MINSTFGGFMTARQGMAASQHGLNLTGHNLTNSATEGYTRQRIDQVSLNFNGTYRYASQYNVNVGNGVLVTGTSQLRDPFLDLRYRNEVAHVGEQGIKLEVLGDLQSILDEVKNAGDDTLGDGGIFNQLGDVLAKLQQLSNEVGNKEFDNMVKSSCQSLVTLFQSYDKRIQEVEDNLAYDLENVDVPRVNEILKSISELNKTIKSNEIMGDSALELKDQRNLLIDELSNYMKIRVNYKPVQVSDSTVVDELTISMVGSDGNQYALIADEQVRELILTDDGNQKGPGNYNIGLSALSPVDVELKAALQSAMNGVGKISETLKNNYETAEKTLADALKKQNNLNTLVAAAQAEVDGLPADADEKTKNKAQAKLDAAKQKLTDYENGDLKTAKEAYTAAVDALPSAEADTTASDGKTTLPGLITVFGSADQIPENLLSTVNPREKVKGNDVGLEEAALAADNKIAAALENLKNSELSGAGISSINDLLVDGSLKGTLEMLNYSAEYDNPPNSIHGIGYFHNMLDTLAYEFATKMNAANAYYDENGVLQNDHPLFKSEDGQKIDAGNIALADGWVKNEYGITPSRQVNPSSGSNDNILHMISMFGEKFGFKASENLMSTVQMSGNTTTLNGMKPGDTVTIDGKTYTYVKGATGDNGTEFQDLDTLKNAASKNGILVEETDGVLTATAKDGFDLKNLITVQGNQVSDLSDININKLSYGDQIVIDGNTFTYKAPAEAASLSGNEFNDFGTLKTAAEKQNINITGDAAAGTITAVTRVNKTAETVSVDKAPNLNDLKPGDTITIGTGTAAVTFTYVTPEYTQNNPDAVVEHPFGSAQQLMEMAEQRGLDVYVDENTGEITSASTTGSSLFNGTFEEYFTNIGNMLGLDIQSTTEMLDNYTQLASTIAQSREAVTGVSLDEEAMNIMRYQQSYNASARLMTALDEMLTTLISNTGVAGR